MVSPRRHGLVLVVALVGVTAVAASADGAAYGIPALRQAWMRKHRDGYALSRRAVAGFDDVSLYSKMFFDYGPVFAGARIGRREVMASSDDSDTDRDLFADVSTAMFRSRRWTTLRADARVALARRWVEAGEPDGVSVGTDADAPGHAPQARQDGGGCCQSNRNLSPLGRRSPNPVDLRRRAPATRPRRPSVAL